MLNYILALTVDNWQMGYGAQGITGAVPMVGEVLILAGVALIYIAYRGGEKNGAD
jgi:hypothetical protein